MFAGNNIIELKYYPDVQKWKTTIIIYYEKSL